MKSRYDKLVIACGSTSATHGVPGLENCFQLKTISDAQQIRKRIIGSSCKRDPLSSSSSHAFDTDNFETASLPTTSPEERRRLLSFVVCGGGPTGVETAAEIYDLCQEDIINYVCFVNHPPHDMEPDCSLCPLVSQDLPRRCLHPRHSGAGAYPEYGKPFTVACPLPHG